MECCTLPDLLDPKIIQECRDEFDAEGIEWNGLPAHPPPPPSQSNKAPPRRHGPPGHHRCWHCFTCAQECVFNATELMMDGELDAEKSLEHFIQAASESDSKWSREIIEDAFSACNDKVKIMRDKFEKRAAKRPNSPENEMECSPIPQHLMRCIHGQLYRTCPEGIRVESQECTDLQEYLNNCHGPLEWKKGHRHPE
uniref:OBP47-like domain-containing protein n=1 Tax=Phlebotomus papatasi TaxID=29031 RepID=A0A1B0D5S9_PHLPP